jgi:hypothetical protein
MPRFKKSLIVSKIFPLSTRRSIYFLLNEQPSVRRALPPVGWQRTCEQPSHHILVSPLFFIQFMAIVRWESFTGALDDSLSVREDSCDCEAAGALDVHEEGARAWDEGLELVLARFRRWRWVEKIDCENLRNGDC